MDLRAPHVGDVKNLGSRVADLTPRIELRLSAVLGPTLESVGKGTAYLELANAG